MIHNTDCTAVYLHVLDSLADIFTVGLVQDIRVTEIGIRRDHGCNLGRTDALGCSSL